MQAAGRSSMASGGLYCSSDGFIVAVGQLLKEGSIVAG